MFKKRNNVGWLLLIQLSYSCYCHEAHGMLPIDKMSKEMGMLSGRPRVRPAPPPASAADLKRFGTSYQAPTAGDTGWTGSRSAHDLQNENDRYRMQVANMQTEIDRLTAQLSVLSGTSGAVDTLGHSEAAAEPFDLDTADAATLRDRLVSEQRENAQLKRLHAAYAAGSRLLQQRLTEARQRAADAVEQKKKSMINMSEMLNDMKAHAAEYH